MGNCYKCTLSYLKIIFPMAQFLLKYADGQSESTHLYHETSHASIPLCESAFNVITINIYFKYM